MDRWTHFIDPIREIVTTQSSIDKYGNEWGKQISRSADTTEAEDDTKNEIKSKGIYSISRCIKIQM